MNQHRRSFLKKTTLLTGGFLAASKMNALAAISKTINTLEHSNNSLTIFHTNDLHGKINSTEHNIGGLKQIARSLSNENIRGLLLDAGDFLDESHTYGADKEIVSAMNALGYHAATVGNHELSKGEDYLAALLPSIQFPLINCNYTFSNETLKKEIKSYVIIKYGTLRIGITGVGPQLTNGTVKFHNPYESATAVAKKLKEENQCDMVICLSHLGFEQETGFDSKGLASNSANIDVVISGHNQTFTNGVINLKNKEGYDVMLSHVAWDGLKMGKMVFNCTESRVLIPQMAEHFFPGIPAGYMQAKTHHRIHTQLHQDRLA